MTNTSRHTISLLGLIVFLLFAFGSSDSEDDGTRTSSYHRMLAYNVAEEYVKPKLKSPRTADFPNIYEKDSHIKEVGEGRFRINSWVDSQNSFGAIVRSNWSCDVFIDESEDVRVTNVRVY